MTQHIEEALIGYVLHYGGMCRDCADMDGVCQSGMPCDTDQRRAVIRHTIAALTYGINNGFITSPFTDTSALAAAEERGRIEERERCAAKEEAFDKIVAARWKHVEAVNAYNARRELATAERMRGSWAIKLAEEYRAMHDAQSDLFATMQAVCDAAITKEPTP